MLHFLNFLNLFFIVLVVEYTCFRWRYHPYILVFWGFSRYFFDEGDIMMIGLLIVCAIFCSILLLLLLILRVNWLQLFPSILTGIKIMTKFLKISDLPQFQTIHFPFNIVQHSQIMLMRFFILHHRFGNILYLFKSQSFTFLTIFIFTVTIVKIMVPISTDDSLADVFVVGDWWVC